MLFGVNFKLVPKAGLEPARALTLAGFSYYHNFRYQTCLFVVWTFSLPYYC